MPGRAVGGGRVYFDCGGLILALLTPEESPTPLAEYVYFAVDNLEQLHARAIELGRWPPARCTASPPAPSRCGRGANARSTPATRGATGLCFADDKTLFTGRR